jgi:outer membrane protein insertion porin family
MADLMRRFPTRKVALTASMLLASSALASPALAGFELTGAPAEVTPSSTPARIEMVNDERAAQPIQLAQADNQPPGASPAETPPGESPPVVGSPTPSQPAAVEGRVETSKPTPEPATAAAPATDQTAAPAPADTTAAPPPAPAPAVEAPWVAARIRVEGNERIESSTVLSYLSLQPGDQIDAARIDLALKTLFRTDLFSDVKIDRQGDDLVVRVVENPIINQVAFEGNKSLKEDKLRDEVQIRPRGIFTRAKVEADVQRIIELYRRSGRISASVTPKIVQLPQKRVDLVFEIDEGPKSGILRVNFLGNKAYSDNDLRDQVVTRESRWYRLFSSNDNYDPDRIEYDREQLRKFYRNRGYYDFRVVSAVAELAPNKNGFVITYTIDEGPKYHFGKVTVETDLKRLNGDLLRQLLPIKEGQLYEDDRIEKATDALTYSAGASGFAFVDIRPRYTAHADTKTVDVAFDIREGPRVYVERIDVVGNTRTLDTVIRREMRVAEGDAYNRVLVDRSKNQILALGFFKDVDIEQLPGSAPDKTILRVKVQEQATGELTFSIGYSSVESLVGDIGITERNFRGRGQSVELRLSAGYLRQQLDFHFTEPRFLGRNMSGGFDLYTYRYNFSDETSFVQSSTGGTLRTYFPINNRTSLGLRYSLHADNVSVESFLCDADANGNTLISRSVCDERGGTLTSEIGYTIHWDHRDNPLRPTRGFYVDLMQDLAGVGGDVKYIKTQLAGGVYHGFKPEWVLSFTGNAGYINGWGGDIVRINDRFFRGGDSFRGFEIAGLGPRDTSLGDVGSSLGGKAYAIGTVTLSFPNFLPDQYGIKTELFTDFGTVGLLDNSVKQNLDGSLNTAIKDDLGLRASAGISIYWRSPMGPLRFDLSHVLAKESYDRTETFRFSTSTRF